MGQLVYLGCPHGQEMRMGSPRSDVNPLCEGQRGLLAALGQPISPSWLVKPYPYSPRNILALWVALPVLNKQIFALPSSSQNRKLRLCKTPCLPGVFNRMITPCAMVLFLSIADASSKNQPTKYGPPKNSKRDLSLYIPTFNFLVFIKCL